MPSASQWALPALPAPSTLTGRSVTPGASPRTSPWPAMMPATCVPWPLSSAGVPSPLTKSAPWTSSTTPSPSSSRPLAGISAGLVQMWPRSCARSSCTPVSSTATRTPLPGSDAAAGAAEAPSDNARTASARRTIPRGIGQARGALHNHFWVFRLLEAHGLARHLVPQADGDLRLQPPMLAMAARAQLLTVRRQAKLELDVAALRDRAARLAQPRATSGELAELRDLHGERDRPFLHTRAQDLDAAAHDADRRGPIDARAVLADDRRRH